MKIQFCGAVKSVTGSCHLVTVGDNRFLLDCGQFQGSDIEDSWNAHFDFDPAEIDFVLLSHAHIDHSGRLPLLVKRGFRGKIYCSAPTADLLDIMLLDSAYIHERETEWDNRKATRAGAALKEPLYTTADAQQTLLHVTPVLYDQLLKINEDIEVVFNDAGHILGSAIIEVFAKEAGEQAKLVFSGDLGMPGKPILRNPTIIKKADYLIMETTYGDRAHAPNTDSVEALIDIILKTARRGGNTIIPSFAVGRTQELIYELNRHYESHSEVQAELNQIMVYIDSPLATSATEVFQKNASVFDDEMRDYILRGDNPLDFKNLRFTRSSDESRSLNSDPTPKVIIAASGMCEAGRIKHHLKHNLWNSRSSIVFVGFQATGTLGRSILNGDKGVTIFGEKIHVAAEIHNLEGFSGHADRDALLNWLGGFHREPYQIYLVHGETQAKLNFADSVKNRFGYNCTVVHEVSEFELKKDHAQATVLSAEQRLADEDARNKLKQTVSGVQTGMENLLYKASLAIENPTSPEQLEKINEIVLTLEKNMVDLGVTLSR